MGDVVFFGGCNARAEDLHHLVLVSGVERVSSTHHHDDVDFKTQVTQGGHHFIRVCFIYSGEGGDLHGTDLHRGCLAEALHLSSDDELAVITTWEFAVIIR